MVQCRIVVHPCVDYGSNGNEIDNLSNGNNNNNSNNLNNNANATNADNASNGTDIQDADNRLHCRDKQPQPGMGRSINHTSLNICRRRPATPSESLCRWPAANNGPTNLHPHIELTFFMLLFVLHALGQQMIAKPLASRPAPPFLHHTLSHPHLHSLLAHCRNPYMGAGKWHCRCTIILIFWLRKPICDGYRQEIRNIWRFSEKMTISCVCD